MQEGVPNNMTLRVGWGSASNRTLIMENINIHTEGPYAGVCGDILTTYNPGDITGPENKRDCVVDKYDLAILARQWLECTDPDGVDCYEYTP